jgi:hypothetical protein
VRTCVTSDADNAVHPRGELSEVHVLHGSKRREGRRDKGKREGIEGRKKGRRDRGKRDGRDRGKGMREGKEGGKREGKER